MRPGDWVCSTCGFVMHKVLLSMATGGAYVDDRLTREACPNDGTLLVPDERDPEPEPDPHPFTPLRAGSEVCEVCACRAGAPWHKGTP